MMFNQVTLIGNVGRDPETRYSQSGMAITNFSVATTEKRKNEEKTEWHRCTAFDKLAEICGKYLTKGSKVFIQGSIHYGEYTDKDGNKRNTTDITINQMKMLGGNGERSETKKQKQAPQVVDTNDFDDLDGIPF